MKDRFTKDESTGIFLASGEVIGQWKTQGIDNPRMSFHKALHGLLANFVNGLDSSPATAIWPFSYLSIPRDRNLEVAAKTAKLLDFDVPALYQAASNKYNSPFALAEAIAISYKVLKTQSLNNSPAKKMHAKSKVERKKWLSNPLVHEFAELQELVTSLMNLRDHGVSSIWIHGSLATLDYVRGYSDCDVTVLIDEDSCISPKRLINLRTILASKVALFHRIDPLQHHGFFVITDIDLLTYQHTFFPMGILNRSVELLRDTADLSYIDADSDYVSVRDDFLRMVQLIRVVGMGHLKLRTAYAVKAHLQTVILLTVIYLEIRDYKFWEKGAALKSIAEELPDEFQSIFENITQLRKRWSYHLRLPLMNIFSLWNPRLPPAYFRATSYFFTRKLKRFLRVDWEYACMELSEFLLSDLRRKGRM
jgi:hypothetical protein